MTSFYSETPKLKVIKMLNFEMMNGLKFGNPYFSICVLHNLTQLKLLHQIDWGEVRLTRIKSDIDLTCDRKRQASAIPLHIRFSFVMHYSFVLLSCLVTQIGWKAGSYPSCQWKDILNRGSVLSKATKKEHIKNVSLFLWCIFHFCLGKTHQTLLLPWSSCLHFLSARLVKSH